MSSCTYGSLNKRVSLGVTLIPFAGAYLAAHHPEHSDCDRVADPDVSGILYSTPTLRKRSGVAQSATHPRYASRRTHHSLAENLTRRARSLGQSNDLASALRLPQARAAGPAGRPHRTSDLPATHCAPGTAPRSKRMDRLVDSTSGRGWGRNSRTRRHTPPSLPSRARKARCRQNPESASENPDVSTRTHSGRAVR